MHAGHFDDREALGAKRQHFDRGDAQKSVENRRGGAAIIRLDHEVLRRLSGENPRIVRLMDANAITL